MQKEPWVNADHGDDLMYMFGYPFSVHNDTVFTTDEVNLSRRMINHWSQFARTGEPGWSRYTVSGRSIKKFDKVDSMSTGNTKNWQARCKHVSDVIDMISALEHDP